MTNEEWFKQYLKSTGKQIITVFTITRHLRVGHEKAENILKSLIKQGIVREKGRSIAGKEYEVLGGAAHEQ
ncbi:hypothetical protein WJQ79_001012 [Listeria monocytogenes]|uniref:FtsK gamma domain-containing protein n=1 Tax=Listeria seeligeri FSL N1-067 TaxID=702453 RepID=E3ZPR2_LISSE|nr:MULTISPECIES: hypothetical protein [Listeria]EAA0137935.1 hypothetical protein [Listeria monocytogenes]EAC4973856.1 hypothetical protein [Listeria monocytogenes]EAC7573729.1 hypothetical protein [Listeria monocytogenes]EAC7610436.1 hypothetical protein [Listeria monocytogenes]EAD8656641.1 hypothetical protein [Listeria monocytogenes]